MERKKIAVKKLILDSRNPRFTSPIEAQSEALEVFSTNKKTLSLARDIAKHGINPAEQVIVTSHAKDRGFYVVLEGNRRLAALRLLDDPTLASTEVLKTKFKQTRDRASLDIPAAIECLIVNSRKEAEHWLELKHRGELDGAGLVAWGTIEQARFNRERGVEDPNIPALEVYERCRQSDNELDDEATSFPLTTLQRIIETAHVKNVLGLRIQDSKLISNRPVRELEKLFGKMVTDLETKKIKVDDVKTAGEIKGYVDGISRREKLKLKPQSRYTEFDAAGKDREVRPRGNPGRAGGSDYKERHTLAPGKFSTSCSDRRIQALVKELKKIKVDKFPNAGMSLLRMLLEMSSILYHKKHRIQRNQQDPLSKSLKEILDHLLSSDSLQNFEAKPVRVLVSAPRNDPRSLDSIQAMLHNPRYVSTPHELITRWDELEPFIKAMCDGF
jgi:hypothetical protein